MPMTVSEMAEHARKRGAAKDVFIERVHRWTRERLLSPIGKRSPGTGRHRRYPDIALEAALILDELAIAGLPVSTMRNFVSTIRSAEAPIGWREKAKQGVPIYFEIAHMPDGSMYSQMSERQELSKEHKLVFTINLTKLLDPLFHPHKTEVTHG